MQKYKKILETLHYGEKELSLQLNNINIGDFKMKKTNFAVAGLSLCLLFSSCGTNQKTGTAVGAGSGAALGALVGGIAQQYASCTGARRCCYRCSCWWRCW